MPGSNLIFDASIICPLSFMKNYLCSCNYLFIKLEQILFTRVLFFMASQNNVVNISLANRQKEKCCYIHDMLCIYHRFFKIYHLTNANWFCLCWTGLKSIISENSTSTLCTVGSKQSQSYVYFNIEGRECEY